jgi:hypothetical protein
VCVCVCVCVFVCVWGRYWVVGIRWDVGKFVCVLRKFGGDGGAKGKCGWGLGGCLCVCLFWCPKYVEAIKLHTLSLLVGFLPSCNL